MKDGEMRQGIDDGRDGCTMADQDLRPGVERGDIPRLRPRAIDRRETCKCSAIEGSRADHEGAVASVYTGALRCGDGDAGARRLHEEKVLHHEPVGHAVVESGERNPAQDLATGKTEDVTGVMTAMEKSDLAFKTLLAIRAKLMDAYEEIKSISV